MGSSIKKQLIALEELQAKLHVKKGVLVEKAMSGQSPADILAAHKVLQGIENRQEGHKKSFVLDPLDFQNSFGYKDKPFALSYNTLKKMSKTPIINAILKTRKNQIADFAEPQADRYSTGFVIKKKRKFGEKEKENTKQEWSKIEEITEFILNCGVGNSWENDDFETFIRKIVDDSMTYDQMTFEVVRDRKGKPFEFFATDAATFRVADSYDDDEYKNKDKEKIKGYYPSYVQIFQGNIKADFYPWELCFGVRNPSSNLYNNGYGVSELEELVSTVTSLLWAEEYNKRFFSQGSAPKGLLRVKGTVNEKELKAFRQEWLSMVSGVQNSWKTPIVGADIDWVDLQKTNRDMEYNSWNEYLIKIACAIYSIDPNEIGFNISSSSGGSLFEGSNEQRLKHSKDKGLYPLLKFIQRKINKHIVNQIDPEYEFHFVGLNGLTISEELEIDIKKLSNFQTLNEIRAKYGLDPVKGGDLILNPTYAQQLNMQAQMEAQKAQQGQEEEDDDRNPFTSYEDDEDENGIAIAKSFLSKILR